MILGVDVEIAVKGAAARMAAWDGDKGSAPARYVAFLAEHLAAARGYWNHDRICWRGGGGGEGSGWQRKQKRDTDDEQ